MFKRTPDIIIRDIQEPNIRKNFENLDKYFIDNNQLLGFKFLEVIFDEAGTKRVAHGLGYVPKDIIRTHLSGDSTVTFDYLSFDSSTISVTSTGMAQVRFFVGSYYDDPRGQLDGDVGKDYWMTLSASSTASSSGSSTSSSFRTIRADDDITSDDDVILCDSTYNSITITLPTAVGISGRVYKIKRITGGSNNITIDANAYETIDGSSTYVLRSLNETITIVSDNENWIISDIFNSGYLISTYLASGSRVTGSAPSSIGQYRSYLRNAGANTYTETNGTPTATPSTANGIKLYQTAAFASADTNNSPSRYEIYIGTNKNFKLLSYRSTGRTGYIDFAFYQNGGQYLGCLVSYDPTTGVLNIVNHGGNGGLTPSRIGTDETGTLINADAYFDILVL